MFPCSKIWLVGDSLSRGIVFDAPRGKLTVCKESFFTQLGARLKPALENISRLGCTVLRGSQALEKRLQQDRPDMVAIEFGGNDCDYDWDAIALNPHLSHQPKTQPAVFEQTLTAMVKRLQHDDIVPVLFNLPPIDADRYFRTITHGDQTRAQRILQWLGNVTHIYWWHERYSVAVGAVAEKTGAHLVDIRRAFLYTDDYRAYIGDDGIHPNHEGHKLIAATLLQAARDNCSWILS